MDEFRGHRANILNPSFTHLGVGYVNRSEHNIETTGRKCSLEDNINLIKACCILILQQALLPLIIICYY